MIRIIDRNAPKTYLSMPYAGFDNSGDDSDLEYVFKGVKTLSEIIPPLKKWLPSNWKN